MSEHRPDSKWIDITVPLRDSMVHWPGDPDVSLRRISSINSGGGANISAISMGAHTGTHMDAPLHFLADGEGIDRLPLETVMGRARVLEITDPDAIGPEELARHNIRRGERLLFKTANSPAAWRSGRFADRFVYISDRGADFLVERGVSLIGIDYLSVGAAANGGYVHRTLLEAGIWLLEGLDLSKVASGRYQLACLPLKLAGADGAPARAILKPLK